MSIHLVHRSAPFLSACGSLSLVTIPASFIFNPRALQINALVAQLGDICKYRFWKAYRPEQWPLFSVFQWPLSRRFSTVVLLVYIPSLAFFSASVFSSVVAAGSVISYIYTYIYICVPVCILGICRSGGYRLVGCIVSAGHRDVFFFSIPENLDESAAMI